jgi:hypothetical protein
MSQAWALALIALLILVLVRPLAPTRAGANGALVHTLAGLSAAVLILGCGLSLAARHAEPAAAVDVTAE